jgi:SAM-dependent methyltransferase
MVVGTPARSRLSSLAGHAVTARPQVVVTPAQVAARMTCPICDGAMYQALSGVRDPQSGEAFDLVRCSRCQLGITVPAPEDLEPYYGERYYGGRHWITRRYCAWRRMRVISQTTRGTAPSTLVDIGCGDGSFLLEARQAGWNVLGTEVNDRIPSPGLEIWGSIADLRARAPFGCITLWHSLEHFRNPTQAQADLAQMLVPGGVIVVAVPDSRGWQARLFGRYWLHLDVPRHLSHFSLPSLRAALGQAGLEVIRVWHHEAEYDWFGWIQSALNRIMPRPNILFDALTRRPRRVSRALVAANAILGLLWLIPAFGATVVSTWMGQGGTLIVVGRRGAGTAPEHANRSQPHAHEDLS